MNVAHLLATDQIIGTTLILPYRLLCTLSVRFTASLLWIWAVESGPKDRVGLIIAQERKNTRT